MALRQGLIFPGMEFVAARDLQILPALKSPVGVDFRKGSDSKQVATDILASSYVRLSAAVGSGKSTLIPTALAMVSRSVVFHVFPFRHMAALTYHYVVKRTEATGSLAVPYEMYSESMIQVPRTGVVFIAAVDMVDFMWRMRKDGDFSKVALFLDEAHNPDAYTEVLRSMALTYGVRNLVLASATFEPSGFQMRETQGKVREHVVDLGHYNDWDVTDKRSPFYYASLVDGIAVIVDNNIAARKLASEYIDCGLETYVLNGKSSTQEVLKAFSSATHAKGLVALILDSSFRSSVYLPVSRLVDTGKIAYYDGTVGTVRRCYRRIFNMEKEQTAGRVGRGVSDADYFVQVGSFDDTICDLEPVEMEAAAYIFKCFGYKPTGIVATATMARESFSDAVGIRAILCGNYPMTFYLGNDSAVSSLPLNNYGIEPPSYEQHVRDDRLKRDSGVSVSDRSEIGALANRAAAIVDGVQSTEWSALLQRVATHKDDVAEVVREDVYYIPQVEPRGRTSMHFENDVDSILDRCEGKSAKYYIRSLSSNDRIIAFSELLNHYNIVVARVRGTKAAVIRAAKVRDSSTFMTKVRSLIQELSIEHAKALACLRVAVGLADDQSWYESHLGSVKTERDIEEIVYSQLMSTATLRDEHSLDKDLSKRLSTAVDKLSISDSRTRHATSVSQGAYCQLEFPSWTGLKRVRYEVERSVSSTRVSDDEVEVYRGRREEYTTDDKHSVKRISYRRRYTKD